MSSANNQFLLPNLAKLVSIYRSPVRKNKINHAISYMNFLEAKSKLITVAPLHHLHCSSSQNHKSTSGLVSSYMRPFSLSSYNGDSRRRTNGHELGETSIMRQEGHEIQEVPLAVLKRSDCETTEDITKTSKKPGALKSYIDLDPREEKAFIEGFSSFNTPQQVLKMLDTIPVQEVTPFVSLSILKKLFELENNFLYRNNGRSWVISAENSVIETFARTAIVSRLVDTIISSDSPDVLLSCIDVLSCEKIHENDQDNNASRRLIFEEVLLRVTQGKLTVSQVCRAVVSLGKMETERGRAFQNDLIDKLWIGILEKSADINLENIVEVFRVIQYFKKSRRLVLNLAEKKLLSLWWKMDCKVVSDICSILISEDRNSSMGKIENNRRVVNDSWGVSNRLLLALSRCASLNIHQVKEDELLQIVKAFNLMNFCDESIEKALNKYMKARCLKILDVNLIAVILDYAKKFQIRGGGILDGAAEFVALHKGLNLSPSQLTSIVTAYGHLDYQPPNGIRFWQSIESFIDKKFIQFRPKDIIDVLLSCVYLAKFPINFIDRIFSPYFLDRLHTSEVDFNLLQDLKSRLKLLDIALTIELNLDKYSGPKLPKDFTVRSVFVDGRILRMSNFIEEFIIKEVVTRGCLIEKNMIIPSLPLNQMYIADMLLYSPNLQEFDRPNYLRNRIYSRLNTGLTCQDNPKNLTVILILIPEHFSRDRKNLIGPQTMRIRHLKTFGFNVATLQYETLAELKVHPEALKSYLKERLLLAGFPVP